MLGGPFPPMPAPDVVWRRMRRLAAQATVDVHTQHLVSRALLGQFAAPIGQHRAAQVYALNLEYPHAKLKGRGLKTCGSAPVEDFVKFEPPCSLPELPTSAVVTGHPSNNAQLSFEQPQHRPQE